MYLLHAPERGTPGCHICLDKSRPLTKEHIPPRSAFNDDQRLIQRFMLSGEHTLAQRHRKYQGGFWARTICRICNNDITACYARHYVAFAKHVANMPTILDDGGFKRLVNVACDPLYVAKQISAMILAVEPFGVSRSIGKMRDFVLNERSILESDIRVYGFLVPDSATGGTITPHHARVDSFAPGTSFVGGEVSFFPFGFVYASEIGLAYKPAHLTDITHWFRHSDETDRRRTTGGFYYRRTGVGSIQEGLGLPRVGAHVDVFSDSH